MSLEVGCLHREADGKPMIEEKLCYAEKIIAIIYIYIYLYTMLATDAD